MTRKISNSTLTWIIGCLIGAIVILTTYLILKELDIVKITFADAFSVASTICSIILSVLAIGYTFSSAREGRETTNQIQHALHQIDIKSTELADLTKQNSDMIKTMYTAQSNIEEALRVMKSENPTETEKNNAIQNIEKTKTSMSMFLNRMTGVDKQ